LYEPDHLNTPRLVADATGSTVWRWDQAEPFGDSPADENPSGAGPFDLPLRLPGQYYDAESGLHYNYFRDYDPSIGSYKQSDPIGLLGGINSYVYAEGSPLTQSDARGQQSSWPGMMAGQTSVASTEAQGLSTLQNLQNGWNSPDPCTLAYLRKNHPALLAFVRQFSLANYVSGPWNMDPRGPSVRVKQAIYTAAGGKLVSSTINKKFPKTGPKVTKTWGYTSALAIALASAYNFWVFNNHFARCGCESPASP